MGREGEGEEVVELGSVSMDSGSGERVAMGRQAVQVAVREERRASLQSISRQGRIRTEEEEAKHNRHARRNNTTILAYILALCHETSLQSLVKGSVRRNE